MIHTPYHFVPLSDWIYMPDWAHLVSHDVPFQDGFSGTIEYTLTNATPLCVGAEQQRADRQPTKVLFARDPKGNPIIPGSSIKGMLRNVLEIAAFGKFNRVEDSRFSYRDISNANTTYAKELQETDVEAYWLKYDEQQRVWLFRKAQWVSVFHDDLTKYTKKGFKNSPNETAVDKYKKWPLTNEAIPFSLQNRTMMGTRGKEVTVTCAGSMGTGDLLGYPVFSGFRPGKKELSDARLGFSYMFYQPAEQAKTFEQGTALVNRLFENHNEDLVTYLKKNQQPELGIPVFARRTKQGQLVALGFAKMPRKLFDYSIHDLIYRVNDAHQSQAFFDLAELIFGTLRDSGLSLRGRVSFSDCVLPNAKKHSTYFSNAVVLNNPKATFFPAYLEQPDSKRYSDYSGFAARLNGWKRYISKKPAHQKLAEQDVSDKDNVTSQLELLGEGAEFTGRLVFHNLKTEELGALLWLLDFESQQGCYHSLGHGKPFGAGAVQFKINNLNLKPNSGTHVPTMDALKNSFVAEISKCCSGWQQSPQIKYLLAMAKLAENADLDTSYMPLRAFQDSRKETDRLLPFNKIPRKDGLKKDDNVSLAFGKGRLAHLIDNATVRDADLIKERNLRADDLARLAEKEKQELLKQQQEAEKQRQLDNLSPGLKAIALLDEFLATADGQAKPPKLRETVQLFLDEGFCEESAMQLYRLARKHDFHKTPKKKIDEHKQLLADLVTRYKLQV